MKEQTLPSEVKDAKYYEDYSFYGTDQYHKVTLGKLLATDGAKDCFEKNKCFWIADVISSYLDKLKKREDTFFVARVFKHQDDTADFYIDDGDENIVVHQKIPYSDLKVNVKMYVQPSSLPGVGDCFVALMPTEY